MKVEQAFLVGALCILPLKDCSAAEPPRYRLQGVEVVGSGSPTGEAVRAKFEEGLKAYLRKLSGSSKKAAADAENLKASLEKGVQDMGGFAFVRLDRVKVSESGGAEDVLLVFEVVEETDKASRMPMRPAPAKDVEDPSGLLEAYGRYQALGWSLFREGKIGLGRVECPAFYCSWGSATPELKSLETQFVEGVPIHEKQLREVLDDGKDPVGRSRALFLLTYLRDGRAVAELAANSLLDPDPQVRETSMEVFNELALYHPKVAVPLREIAALLRYPDAGDRGRALSFFVTVSSNEDARAFLLGDPADRVLGLLRSKHPADHEAAYRLLCLLSHEKYGDQDYDSWSAWLLRTRKAAADQ